VRVTGHRLGPVVAIDGPAGVGKSTAARRLAERMGFTLVETGALYRAVALVARDLGVPWDDEARLERLTAELDIELGTDAGASQVRVGGVDRSEELRSPEISMGASAVSRHPGVRRALLGIQRQLGSRGGVVLEGRDIGTVVFPDAEVKVFLTAAPEVRARRRHDELRQRGDATPFEATLEDVLLRDEQDRSRAVAPLVAAEDAALVDTGNLSLDEVVDRLEALVRGRMADSL